MRIDLNCDMGEGFGRYSLGDDRQMIGLISSASLACGFHAGDPVIMDGALALCRLGGVAVGAHPGYPDPRGFGRRALGASPEEIRLDVIYQVGALAALARTHGLRLAHVKPHGALYNAAAADEAIAQAVAEAVLAVDPALALVCLAGPAGRMQRQLSERAGLRVAAEFFADRAYLADGRLAPRQGPGALITEPQAVVDRCLALLERGGVACLDGGWLPLEAQTICLHGDGPTALATARLLRPALERAGVSVEPLGGLPA